ncbi:MAG TPA: NUDIX domain-containing protein [Longimicrobiaceae bacterium]|jgi:predicted NUDIX family NTP pyrophosphohydrolase
MTAAKRPNVSAGLLLFRRGAAGLELFLAHPGGPFWAGRDEGAWTLPKGLVEEGEEPLDAARREFREETGIEPAEPFLPLGSIRQKAGKTVHAWAWEGDADPDAVRSNTMRTEWPRNSGRWITFPEVDRCAWLDPATARTKINAAQAELIDRLEALLEGTAGNGVRPVYAQREASRPARQEKPPPGGRR